MWVAIVCFLRWRVACLNGQRYLGKPVDGITQQGIECFESCGQYLVSVPSRFFARRRLRTRWNGSISDWRLLDRGGFVRGRENSKSRREIFLLPTERPKITTRLSKLTWTEAQEGSALSTSEARKPRLDSRQFARLSTKTMPQIPSSVGSGDRGGFILFSGRVTRLNASI
jgi:hypothetical protein